MTTACLSRHKIKKWERHAYSSSIVLQTKKHHDGRPFAQNLHRQRSLWRLETCRRGEPTKFRSRWSKTCLGAALPSRETRALEPRSRSTLEDYSRCAAIQKPSLSR
ncbi:hypothetical protein LIA77_05105 [Sarocladium implicatum]|nr:hypothetical protein LIA77_05105 [Sarocladium implicatum]